MNNIQLGFVKRAMAHGFDEAQAVELLKEAMSPRTMQGVTALMGNMRQTGASYKSIQGAPRMAEIMRSNAAKDLRNARSLAAKPPAPGTLGYNNLQAASKDSELTKHLPQEMSRALGGHVPALIRTEMPGFQRLLNNPLI